MQEFQKINMYKTHSHFQIERPSSSMAEYYYSIYEQLLHGKQPMRQLVR